MFDPRPQGRRVWVIVPFTIRNPRVPCGVGLQIHDSRSTGSAGRQALYGQVRVTRSFALYTAATDSPSSSATAATGRPSTTCFQNARQVDS